MQAPSASGPGAVECCLEFCLECCLECSGVTMTTDDEWAAWYGERPRGALVAPSWRPRGLVWRTPSWRPRGLVWRTMFAGTRERMTKELIAWAPS